MHRTAVLYLKEKHLKFSFSTFTENLHIHDYFASGICISMLANMHLDFHFFFFFVFSSTSKLKSIHFICGWGEVERVRGN